MLSDDMPAEQQIDVSAETERLRKIIDMIDLVDELKAERDEVVRALADGGVSRKELAALTGLSVHGIDAIKRRG